MKVATFEYPFETFKTKRYCCCAPPFKYVFYKFWKMTLIDSDTISFVIIHKSSFYWIFLVEMHIKLIFIIFYLVILCCAFMLTKFIIDDVTIWRYDIKWIDTLNHGFFQYFDIRTCHQSPWGFKHVFYVPRFY